MPTDSVTYEETDEAAAYLEKFTPEHLRRLAVAQAEENAADPEHIATVNDLVERFREGRLKGQPLNHESLRRKLGI